MKYQEKDTGVIIELAEKPITIRLKVEVAELINEFRQDEMQQELTDILDKYLTSENKEDKTAFIAKANMLHNKKINIQDMEHNANITIQINELICSEERNFSDQPVDLLEQNLHSFCEKAKLRNRGS